MDKYYALCVDDDRAVLDQLAFQLEPHFQHFCEFEYAQSAEEAWQMYHELIAQGKRIWLVLCDQIMAGMTGDRLLAQIHEHDHQVIKVLFTGHAGLLSTMHAINHAGLNYYIEKPWAREDLLVILNKLKFQFEMATILNEMNLRFASSINMEETLDTVFFNILHLIQAEAGSIFLLDDYHHDLVCRICRGPKDRNIIGIRVPIGKGIVGHVAETREIDVTMDVKQDQRHYRQVDEKSGFMTRSMVSVPLITKNQVLGVIQVINKCGGEKFSAEDILLLKALSQGAAVAIQNAQYAERLIQQERIRSELLIAHQIQQGILPKPFPGHPAIHFEAMNEPAKDVSGDFYDYFQVNDQEFAFMIGDVCGKGVPASIFMASSRSIIKASALSDPRPSTVLPRANLLISEDAESGIYVTVFYGVYHTVTRLFRFVNAGHTLCLLYRPSSASCASLCNANLPLGLFASAEFVDVEMYLEAGDYLIMYTDGITEAENSDGEQFGVERLILLILEYGGLAASELIDKIIKSVQEFSEGEAQQDDITIMIVRV